VPAAVFSTVTGMLAFGKRGLLRRRGRIFTFVIVGAMLLKMALDMVDVESRDIHVIKDVSRLQKEKEEVGKEM
jgi:hypothetical protein